MTSIVTRLNSIFAGLIIALWSLSTAAETRPVTVDDFPRAESDMAMELIVKQLNALISDNGWENDFNTAIKKAQSYDIYNFLELKKWKDYKDYLAWLDDLVIWAPRERGDTRFVYDKLVEFYFILDQEPVKSLQSPIKPGERMQELTPLSKWILDFAEAWGSYLDTTDSAKHVETFKNDPVFNWDENTCRRQPATFLRKITRHIELSTNFLRAM